MFCHRSLGDGSRSQPARPDPSVRLASSGVPPGGAGVTGERGRVNAKVGRRERMTLWTRAARRWGYGASGAGGGSSDCGAGKGGGIQGRGGRGSSRGIRGEVGRVVDIAYEQATRRRCILALGGKTFKRNCHARVPPYPPKCAGVYTNTPLFLVLSISCLVCCSLAAAAAVAAAAGALRARWPRRVKVG